MKIEPTGSGYQISTGIYLPADDRPCNFLYPSRLARSAGYELLVPRRKILGHKKKPADIEELNEWVLDRIPDADFLIVSIDLILYGGMIPARIHDIPVPTLKKRMELLPKVARSQNDFPIYAHSLILRESEINSSEEEPHYWAEFGKDIVNYFSLKVKKEEKGLSFKEMDRFLKLSDRVPDQHLKDYRERREVNLELNRSAIDLVQKGVIDFLLLGRDDTSRYSLASREETELRNYFNKKRVSKNCRIFPGADQFGSLLLARHHSINRENPPTVSVLYSSTGGKTVTPSYEDRPLGETVRAHLSAVGAETTVSPEDADAVLAVNSQPIGDYNPVDSPEQNHKPAEYDLNRELNFFLDSIERAKHLPQTQIGLADITFPNGSDTELMEGLSSRSLLKNIDAYAGWNTASNSLGTVISWLVLSSESPNFRFIRLLDDWGYQAICRQKVGENWGANFGKEFTNFDKKQSREKAEKQIRSCLVNFMENWLQEKRSFSVRLHWERLFEIEISLDGETRE